MRYRLLGNSGLRVSEAALGTMTLGDDWGWGAAKDEARKVYDAFREAGGNFIIAKAIVSMMPILIWNEYPRREAPPNTGRIAVRSRSGST